MSYSNILQGPRHTHLYFHFNRENGINDTFGMGTIVLLSENVQTQSHKKCTILFHKVPVVKIVASYLFTTKI